MLLLFTQLATAAYACPAAAAAAVPAMADMPGCDGRMTRPQDPDQPLLCQAHCQQGALTVQATPAADAAPTPVLLAVLDWALVDWLPAQPAARASALVPGAAPPGTPPRYLVLLVLRN